MQLTVNPKVGLTVILMYLFLVASVSGCSVLSHNSEEDALTFLEKDRERLVSRLQEKYPNNDRDRLMPRIDAALAGNLDELVFIALLYQIIDEWPRAHQLAIYAADRGSVKARDRFAESFIEGQGKSLDPVRGITYLMDIAPDAEGESAGGVIAGLSKLDFHYALNTKRLRLDWLEYYADKGVTPLLVNGGSSVESVYVEIAEAYEDGLKSRRFSSRRSRDGLKMMAALYYLIAGVPGEANRVQSSDKLSLNHDVDAVCSQVLERRGATYAEFQSVQAAIYDNGGASPAVWHAYQKQVQETLGTHAGERMSLKFLSIRLSLLIKLILHVSFDLPPDRINTIALEDRYVSVPARNYPANVLLNLLASKLGLHATCTQDLITFNISRKHSPNTTFFTPHFITSWGEGFLSREDVVRLEGKIENEELQGPGRFESYGHTLVGDNFVESVLQGEGQQIMEGVSSGEVIYRGDIAANVPHGQGDIFYGGERYTGEFRFGDASGIGVSTYVEHLSSKDSPIQSHYPLDHSDYRVKSTYEGPFDSGSRQGVGLCTVVSKVGEARTFSCEFMHGTLIKVEGVSLLPPDRTQSIHTLNFNGG